MEDKLGPIPWSVFLVAAIILGFSSAIRVTNLNVLDRSISGFVVVWDYQLNGYNSSRLQGFELTVSTLIFDNEIVREDVDRNVSSMLVGNLTSGSTFHVCVAPHISQGAMGNKTCIFASTVYNPWNPRAKIATFIGIGIFATFVLLMVFDVKYPRQPWNESNPRQSTIQTKKNDVTSSNMQLQDNQY